MIARFAPTVTMAEILAFLADVVRLGSPAGEVSREFERRFAAYLECEGAVFVPSGRMALWLILRALGYPPGSEVIVPAFTYFAIPAVIRLAGLNPVYADIDPDTYELSPASVAKVLTARTRAVVPTHLFGRTCDLRGLEDLCGPKGIDLIEDCAQCLGATVGGRKCGGLGRAAYFTFGITKNFTTFGGGMVVCRDRPLLAQIAAEVEAFHPPARAALLKQGITALAMTVATQPAIFSLSLAPVLRMGASDRPDFVHRLFDEGTAVINEAALPALRWRPSDAQARAGLRQLKSLDAKNAARRERGRELLMRLRDAGCAGLPAAAGEGGDHIYMSFALRHPDRYAFAHALRAQGVDSSPGYMSDCSGLPDLGGTPGACPLAAQTAADIVHLPLYPGLGSADLVKIVRAVGAAWEAAGPRARSGATTARA